MPGLILRSHLISTNALPVSLERTAVISACGRYRYLLTREFGPGRRTATFIMLNPSTADATHDDPTIRRCTGFARRWNCGRLIVLNLFAVRATDPADMKRADDPVGPENRDWFDRTLRDPRGGPVVCAWGIHGEHMHQARTVLGWLDRHGARPLALGVTRDGHPRHPLYLPGNTRTIDFGGRCPSVSGAFHSPLEVQPSAGPGSGEVQPVSSSP